MTNPDRYFLERTYDMPRSRFVMETGLSDSASDNDLATAYIAVVEKHLKSRRSDFGSWLTELDDDTVQTVAPNEAAELDIVAASGSAEVLLESISPLTENPNNLVATYQVQIIPVIEDIPGAPPPADGVKEASQAPWLFAGIATAVVGVWLLLRGKK